MNVLRFRSGSLFNKFCNCVSNFIISVLLNSSLTILSSLPHFGHTLYCAAQVKHIL